MDPNAPRYIVSGAERRKLKKRHNSLKSFLKTFWYWHQMDLDMSASFGIKPRDDGHFPMSDEKAQEIYKIKEAEALELERVLSQKLI